MNVFSSNLLVLFEIERNHLEILMNFIDLFSLDRRKVVSKIPMRLGHTLIGLATRWYGWHN